MNTYYGEITDTSFNAMKKELDKILTANLPEFTETIDVKLPKLKLPKLKRV